MLTAEGDKRDVRFIFCFVVIPSDLFLSPLPMLNKILSFSKKSIALWHVLCHSQFQGMGHDVILGVSPKMTLWIFQMFPVESHRHLTWRLFRLRTLSQQFRSIGISFWLHFCRIEATDIIHFFTFVCCRVVGRGCENGGRTEKGRHFFTVERQAEEEAGIRRTLAVQSRRTKRNHLETRRRCPSRER